MYRNSLNQGRVSPKPLSRSRFGLICFGLISVVISSSAQAQIKCDQPRLAHVDATACALAAQDVASLRRYITRTQAIHGLQMKDYVRFEGDEPQAQPTRTRTVQVKLPAPAVGAATPSR